MSQPIKTRKPLKLNLVAEEEALQNSYVQIAITIDNRGSSLSKQTVVHHFTKSPIDVEIDSTLIHRSRTKRPAVEAR